MAHAPVAVTPEEAGQKLTGFLARRVGRDVPRSVLMRWIRTGQIRVDGRRAKPFQRLQVGQEVRLPPQAFAEAEAKALHDPAPAGELEVLLRESDYLALAKPAGLPVHGGTGHTDSVRSRLLGMFPDADFAPTPVHRLDRDTSGVLLVALSYARLREMQELFKAGRVGKEYLAWVAGVWPWSQDFLMCDRLAKVESKGRQRMVTDDMGKEARARVSPLRVEERASLLLLRLETGRTHQLRVQLAARGFPILGDLKYGAPPSGQGLLLHCLRLEIFNRSIGLPPRWSGAYAPGPGQVGAIASQQSLQPNGERS